MYEFCLQGMIYIQLTDITGEKPERKSKIEQKKHLFDYPPIPPVCKMEADCFLVSKGTENKLDLP